VALTRASQQLFVTWCESRKNRTAGPSVYLANIVSGSNLKLVPEVAARPKSKKDATPSLEDELHSWRSNRAKVIRQPLTSVVYDEDLREIAKQLPKTMAQLAEIVGMITAQKIGPEILSIVAKAESRLEDQTLK
ncbi:MAG: HRDC domain-containing protein, partial [Ilumatobacteraceae bacterium]